MMPMSFFRSVNPRAAWQDVVDIWHSEQRYKIHFLALALFTTCVIFTTFLFESDFKVVPKPNNIIYVENWSLDRTDEEIKADRAKVQELKDARDERIRKFNQEQQESYRRLGRKFGMEFDEDAADAASGADKPEPAPAN